MRCEFYRYTFGPEVPQEEIEASLVLALFAVESLHGEAQVRLDAVYTLDANGHECLVDATTNVGRSLNRIFVGFLRREFGPEGFKVERLDAAPPARTPESAAV
jgi:hypothetical protein